MNFNKKIEVIMSIPKKILIVDDDDVLRETLSEQFILHQEFEIDGAATGAEGLEKAKASRIDLILLDVGLPDFDGREVCRLMRKAGVKCPIIMVTGHDSEADTILGLDAGANDYVTKPCRFAILLARVRTHLRSHDQSEDAVFQVGPYTFKPTMKLLEDSDLKKVHLTEKETALLKYLYRAESRVVTRDVLCDKVWGYNSGVNTHTIETHIYRLRQKIESDPSVPQILLTENGGYRLAS